MTEKSKAIVRHVEVVEPRQVVDVREEMRRFVEQTVAEMTSGQANTVFEPFFRNKLLADAIKRAQTVIEQQKWSRYFAKWGCLICASKEEAHSGVGLCQACYVRTAARLKSIIKEAEAEQKEQSLPTDLSAKAQAAVRNLR